MPAEFDVIIVGGGLAGLALACALRDLPLNIALIENQPPRTPPSPVWDARVYALNAANAAWLQKIGIWAQLDKTRLSPVYAMKIVSNIGTASATLNLSAYEADVGQLAWIIESSVLAHALWQSLQQQNTTAKFQIFCPAQAQSLAVEGAAQLKLDSGKILSARLIVGADGAHSWLRNHLGFATHEHAYGEMGVVANFACTQAHRQVARQWFKDDGILACLPLPGKRLSMVYSTPEKTAAELLALSPALLCERIEAATQHVFGELHLITGAAAFPLKLLRVPCCVAPRVVLIGDAAHGIHPLSGHGVNLGLGDAAALAYLLRNAESNLAIGSTEFLARYQTMRRAEVNLMQMATHNLHRLFSQKLIGLSLLRNTGLSLSDAFPALKAAIISYAQGKFTQ